MKERLEKLKGIKKTMDSEVSRGIPVSAVASIFGINDDSVWRILKHYVDSAREKIDPSDIVAKHHFSVTLFYDIKNSRVVDIEEGKESEVFSKFHIKNPLLDPQSREWIQIAEEL